MADLPVITFPAPPPGTIEGPPGPPGPPGPAGADGQPRFKGHGPPPGVIPGAIVGVDAYLDLDTGTVYELV